MTAVAKGNWMGQELVDLRGIPYSEGDYVAKADISGRVAVQLTFAYRELHELM